MVYGILVTHPQLRQVFFLLYLLPQKVRLNQIQPFHFQDMHINQTELS